MRTCTRRVQCDIGGVSNLCIVPISLAKPHLHIEFFWPFRAIYLSYQLLIFRDENSFGIPEIVFDCFLSDSLVMVIFGNGTGYRNFVS